MAKTWSMIIGWILVILGVLGFITNPLVGMSGTFHADMMHDIINIILGAILLWAAYSSARTKVAGTAKWIGIIFLILAILGWFTVGSQTGSLLGIAEVNGADNWLHLVFGLILVWAGMRHGKGHAQQM